MQQLIDPKKLPQTDEMKRGGKQLIELLEKDFSLNYIQENKKKLRITNDEFNMLSTWIKNEADIQETCLELNQKSSKQLKNSDIKKMFLGGFGVLGKLYNSLNLFPKFDENDNLIQKYSFLNYFDAKLQDKPYRIIEITINNDNFSSHHPSKSQRERFNKTYVMKKEGSEWIVTNDDVAKECLESLAVMKKLLE